MIGPAASFRERTAQVPQPGGPEPAPPPKVKKEDEGRDPTRPAPELERVLNAGKSGPAAAQMPTVVLKGRVIGPGGKGIAMLEIEGKLYDVRADNEMNVRGPGGSTIRLRVVEVSARGVRIEMGAAKEAFILH